MRKIVIPLLILIGLLLVFNRDSGSAAPALPCSDSRGCPNLVVLADPFSMQDYVVDAPQTFVSTDCAVQEGNVQVGTRTLLKFSTGILNKGNGAFNLGNMATLAQSHPDLVYWDPCHNHFHIKGFAAYRLWTPAQYKMWSSLQSGKLSSDALLAAHPELTPVVDRKVGFCPVDLIPYAKVKGKWIPSSDYSTQFYNGYCGNSVPPDPGDLAGISPGWSDNYFRSVEAQWVDVTGLHGTFVLENEINPSLFIEESNYRDNSTATTVQIP